MKFFKWEGFSAKRKSTDFLKLRPNNAQLFINVHVFYTIGIYILNEESANLPSFYVIGYPH